MSAARRRAGKNLVIPDPVYARLLAARDVLEAERGRRVSLGETLETVMTHWELASELLRDEREKDGR